MDVLMATRRLALIHNRYEFLQLSSLPSFLYCSPIKGKRSRLF